MTTATACFQPVAGLSIEFNKSITDCKVICANSTECAGISFANTPKGSVCKLAARSDSPTLSSPCAGSSEQYTAYRKMLNQVAGGPYAATSNCDVFDMAYRCPAGEKAASAGQELGARISVFAKPQTSDFKVKASFKLKFLNNTGAGFLFGQGVEEGPAIIVDGADQQWATQGGSWPQTPRLVPGISMAAGVWHTIEFTRLGGQLTIALNGETLSWTPIPMTDMVQWVRIRPWANQMSVKDFQLLPSTAPTEKSMVSFEPYGGNGAQMCASGLTAPPDAAKYPNWFPNMNGEDKYCCQAMESEDACRSLCSTTNCKIMAYSAQDKRCDVMGSCGAFASDEKFKMYYTLREIQGAVPGGPYAEVGKCDIDDGAYRCPVANLATQSAKGVLLTIFRQQARADNFAVRATIKLEKLSGTDAMFQFGSSFAADLPEDGAQLIMDIVGIGSHRWGYNEPGKTRSDVTDFSPSPSAGEWHTVEFIRKNGMLTINMDGEKLRWTPFSFTDAVQWIRLVPNGTGFGLRTSRWLRCPLIRYWKPALESREEVRVTAKPYQLVAQGTLSTAFANDESVAASFILTHRASRSKWRCRGCWRRRRCSCAPMLTRIVPRTT